MMHRSDCGSSPNARAKHVRAVARPGLVTAIMIGMIGCASTSSSPTTTTGRANDGAMDAGGPESTAHLTAAERVERHYVVGRTPARDLGYRIDWQYPGAGSPIRLAVTEGDSIITLDEQNNMTRFRREEGDRIWRLRVADPIPGVFGIAYVPENERIYMLTGSDLFELDAASGSRVGRQKLERIANTAPVRAGNFLIYGSRAGQVVWHAFGLGTTWRAYQVSPSIQIPPIVSDGHVVAVGSDGRVMSLRVNDARQVWNRRALDSIVASPTAGNDVVYVASTDQHLRAYNLRERRTPLWEYLTESALTEGPVLVGDRVYQHVESEGLVCLEAIPDNAPGGVVVWRCTETAGNVVTTRGSQLLVWDESIRQLHVVDARTGAVARTIDLPQTDTLTATSVENGILYATGDDGRFQRLVPRTRR